MLKKDFIKNLKILFLDHIGNTEINRQFVYRLLFLRMIGKLSEESIHENFNILEIISKQHICFKPLFLLEFNGILKHPKIDSIYKEFYSFINSFKISSFEYELFKKEISTEEDISIVSKKYDVEIITPTLLSVLYEELQDDRKGKGSYFTPTPIIKYMVTESVFQSLFTKIYPDLSDKDITDDSRVFIENEFKNYLSGKDYDHNFIVPHEAILKELQDMKILEPAVGSGHFYIYLVDFLFNLYKRVVLDLKLPFNLSYLKHIYHKNLFAIDLDFYVLFILTMRIHLYNYNKVNKLSPVDFNIANQNTLLWNFKVEEPSKIKS